MGYNQIEGDEVVCPTCAEIAKARRDALEEARKSIARIRQTMGPGRLLAVSAIDKLLEEK